MSRIRRRGLAPFATYRIVLGLLVLTWAFYPAGTTRNNPAQATSGTPPSADSQPYDVLRSAYAQYMDLKDPLTFPMKVRAVATNPYKFWRGTKDMFAIWCKTNAGDWLKDRQAYMPIHGDLHLGNIGAYPTGPEPDRMAFGLIDFDDSVRLPFQFELLQGLITLQLAARQNNVELTNAQKVEFSEMLFDWYRRAVQSHRQASDLLANDKEVMRLLSRNKSYEHELLKYTESNGKFRPAVINGERVTNVLRPTAIPVQVFADAVSQAIGNAPRMKAAFRFSDPISVRRAIKDVALRTRTGSCGSQGLKKYLILLDRPLIGADHDLILYIKLEIPTAAERTGLIATDPRPQGQRTVEDTEALTDPQPGFVSWCEIANESYWVTSRDARTDELDPEAIKDYKSLLKAAHIWATVAGAAHGREGRDRVILPRLATELRTSIRRRADTYVTKVLSDFAAFKHDPRVAGDIAAAEEAITASMKPRP